MEGQIQTNEQIAREWLGFTIQGFKEQLRRHRIGKSKVLENSLKGTVSGGAGIRVQVELYYAWYGQMVDMGVGRGIKSGDQRENATMRRIVGNRSGYDRRAKRWYSKGKDGIGFQAKRLSEIIGANQATQAVRSIQNSIDLNHIITLR